MSKRTRDKKLESITDDLFFSFHQFLHRVVREEAVKSKRGFDPSRFVLAIVMKNGPIAMSEIGKRMSISKPYMTALVDRLIREGLVERVPDADDRRVIRVTVTRAGKELVKDFRRERREAVKRHLSALSPSEIDSLYKSMETMRGIISKLDKGDGRQCESEMRYDDR